VRDIGLSATRSSSDGRTGFLFARAVVLALAGALCTACSTDTDARLDNGAPIVVTDDAGREVRLGAPAQRVISFPPAATDLILAMGALDALIARTQYDIDPRISHLTSTGNALNPNIEWIASLRPDLVVAWPDQPSRSVIGSLERISVPAYAASMETIGDILRTTRNLGELLGRKTAADSLAHSIRARLDSVKAAVAGAQEVSVAFVFSSDPPMVAGPRTFIHEVIEAAGGTNAFADSPARWPQVTLEEVLRRDPDVLIINGVGAQATERVRSLRTMPGWRDLTAVRNGRLLPVDANEFTRPGPLVATNAVRVAAFLHPDRAARLPEARQ